jgi:hypothetical protein
VISWWGAQGVLGGGGGGAPPPPLYVKKGPDLSNSLYIAGLFTSTTTLDWIIISGSSSFISFSRFVCGQLDSGPFKNYGTTNRRHSDVISDGFSPREASSLGFSLLGQYLHCCTSDFSLISAIRLPTYTVNLLSSF